MQVVLQCAATEVGPAAPSGCKTCQAVHLVGCRLRQQCGVPGSYYGKRSKYGQQLCDAPGCHWRCFLVQARQCMSKHATTRACCSTHCASPRCALCSHVQTQAEQCLNDDELRLLSSLLQEHAAATCLPAADGSETEELRINYDGFNSVSAVAGCMCHSCVVHAHRLQQWQLQCIGSFP